MSSRTNTKEKELSIISGSKLSTQQQRVAEVRRRMKAHPLLGTLSDLAAAHLVEHCKQMWLNAGDTFYLAGEPATEMMGVLSGGFQIEIPKRGEHRGQVVAMRVAPAWLGECQVLNGLPWSGTGVALVPSLVVAIDVKTYRELLRNENGLALAAYQELTSRFLFAIESWKTQQHTKPWEAVGRYLVGFSQVRRLCGHHFSEPTALSQTAIALATNLRRETVNRLLREWVHKELVQVNQQGVHSIDANAIAQLYPAVFSKSLFQDNTEGSAIQNLQETAA